MPYEPCADFMAAGACVCLQPVVSERCDRYNVGGRELLEEPPIPLGINSGIRVPAHGPNSWLPRRRERPRKQFEASTLSEHRLVADDNGRGLGWVAVSAVSARPAYAGVVEQSVYVDPAAAGRGIGTALLTALLASTEAVGILTIQSAIFPENAASLALHRHAGFRTIGARGSHRATPRHLARHHPH